MAAKKKRVSKGAPAQSLALEKTPTLARMLALVPAIGAEERMAFTSQFTPSACAKLGAQTRSGAVRECAVGWAARVLFAVTGSEKDRVPYSAARLAFVLELIVALDAARSANTKTKAVSGALRTARDLARQRLALLRKRLVALLLRATQGDDVTTAEVTQLRDQGNTDRGSAESVQRLAKVAHKILAGTKAQKLVAGSIGLNASRVDGAEAAAKALLDAREGVALGASGTSQRDSTAVNLVEGRLLLEMRIMRASITEARQDGASLMALVPVAGVAHVFGSQKKRRAEKTK